MKKILSIVAVIAIWAVIISGNYVLLTIGNPGANPSINTPDAKGEVRGFWRGIQHGVKIVPNTIRLIFTDLNLYEPHNNGRSYNLGFGLGSLLSVVVLVIFVVIMWMFCIYLIHGSPIG